MTSTLLGSLNRHLKRLIPEVEDLQRNTERLVKTIDQTSTVEVDKAEEQFLVFAESFITLLQNVRRIGRYGRELGESVNVADRLADVMQVLEGIDLASDVDYIALARRLENIRQPDAIKQTVQELASYETGPERLDWLRSALKELDAKNSTD